MKDQQLDEETLTRLVEDIYDRFCKQGGGTDKDLKRFIEET
jgi:hypothetical protein